MVLQVQGVADADTRLSIERELIKLQGVISVSFDVAQAKAFVCTRSHGDMLPAIQAAVAATGGEAKRVDPKLAALQGGSSAVVGGANVSGGYSGYLDDAGGEVGDHSGYLDDGQPGTGQDYRNVLTKWGASRCG